RQKPNDFVWSTGCRRARPGGREINELADLEFVMCHPRLRAQSFEWKVRSPICRPDEQPSRTRPRNVAGPDAPVRERPDRNLPDPPFGLLRPWLRHEDELLCLPRAELL